MSSVGQKDNLRRLMREGRLQREQGNVADIKNIKMKLQVSLSFTHSSRFFFLLFVYLFFWGIRFVLLLFGVFGRIFLLLLLLLVLLSSFSSLLGFVIGCGTQLLYRKQEKNVDRLSRRSLFDRFHPPLCVSSCCFFFLFLSLCRSIGL